ncbi:MAG: hypothetical protein SVY53_02770 [Chloroflexota bacterium]|nr:hypothetical protein [Chloroflexota bacterium]
MPNGMVLEEGGDVGFYDEQALPRGISGHHLQVQHTDYLLMEMSRDMP